MNFIRRIKAALIFTRHQAWVDKPLWDADDAKQLAIFFTSPAGRRLKAYCLNTVLVQQAQALTADLPRLPFEAGFCAGQKSAFTVIEALADDQNFTTQGEQDADPAAIQPES